MLRHLIEIKENSKKFTVIVTAKSLKVFNNASIILD